MCDTRLTYALDELDLLRARVAALEARLHALETTRHNLTGRDQALENQQPKEYPLDRPHPSAG